MVFSAGHMAPLPVPEPGCWQTNQGQMVTLVRRIGSYKNRIPPFPFSKSHCPDPGGGHPLLHHHPKGSPCTLWLGPTEGTHDGSTPQVLRHWGAHNTPIPWAAQISPAQGWDN